MIEDTLLDIEDTLLALEQVGASEAKQGNVFELLMVGLANQLGFGVDVAKEVWRRWTTMTPEQKEIRDA